MLNDGFIGGERPLFEIRINGVDFCKTYERCYGWYRYLPLKYVVFMSMNTCKNADSFPDQYDGKLGFDGTYC